MRKLKESFEGVGSQKGYTFTQLHRNEDVALYKKYNEEFDLTYYEVFKIKESKEKEAFGRVFEAHEKYPTDPEFGNIAWCYNDLRKALYKYQSFFVTVKEFTI